MIAARSMLDILLLSRSLSSPGIWSSATQRPRADLAASLNEDGFTPDGSSVAQRGMLIQLRTMDWTVLVIAAVAAIGAYSGAYFGERGKIRAQTNALESIVKQEAAKAMAQEEAKQQAVAENLRNLDLQMRTLTTTQEQIKAQISSELWHLQTIWNEKRKLYGELLGVVCKLDDSYTRLIIVLRFKNESVPSVVEDLGAHHNELVSLLPMTHIFAGQDCCNAIMDYLKSRSIPDMPTEEWAVEEGKNLSILKTRLVVAARDDLKIIVAAHA